MRRKQIKEVVSSFTNRPESMFLPDLKANKDLLAAELDGKTALVIGGAGTIGSAFIHQILHFSISELVVVDHNENGLAELIRDIRSSTWTGLPKIITYPLSFGNPIFHQILERHGGFDIVANFAALKHVRSEKDIYAVKAMFENNVLLNARLLELLAQQPPAHFFCVSTDKSTNPVNLMGATKKLMEDVMFSYQRAFPISSARFANVAFSNGSLLDSYIKRMERDQPIVCPTDIKRYFVSKEEAGQLCLLASISGAGGEIFIPRLDEKDLIPFSKTLEAFLEGNKLRPAIYQSEQAARDACKDIQTHLDRGTYPVYLFQTDTTGEKPFEEFYNDNDNVNWNRFQALGVISKKDTAIDVEGLINEGIHLLENMIEKGAFIDYMQKWVPTFQHAEKGKYLDDKM